MQTKCKLHTNGMQTVCKIECKLNTNWMQTEYKIRCKINASCIANWIKLNKINANWILSFLSDQYLFCNFLQNLESFLFFIKDNPPLGCKLDSILFRISNVQYLFCVLLTMLPMGILYWKCCSGCLPLPLPCRRGHHTHLNFANISDSRMLSTFAYVNKDFGPGLGHYCHF